MLRFALSFRRPCRGPSVHKTFVAKLAEANTDRERKGLIRFDRNSHTVIALEAGVLVIHSELLSRIQGVGPCRIMPRSRTSTALVSKGS
jgi:hypothetical protein